MSEMKATCHAHGREASECDDCYKEEQEAFARADVYGVYVNERTGQVTTWPGRPLARITGTRRSRVLYTPTGGRYRRRYVTAEAPDGSRWHGNGSDEWDLVTIRREKPHD